MIRDRSLPLCIPSLTLSLTAPAAGQSVDGDASEPVSADTVKPPTDVTVANHKYDSGGPTDVSWHSSPDDIAGILGYIISRAREACAAAGRPDAYNEDTVHYVTDEQFGYVAAVNGITVRERPATCLYLGAFFAASRFGIWVLMVTFGASFGYTVMGRVSLPVGRLTFLVDEWLGLLSR